MYFLQFHNSDLKIIVSVKHIYFYLFFRVEMLKKFLCVGDIATLTTPKARLYQSMYFEMTYTCMLKASIHTCMFLKNVSNRHLPCLEVAVAVIH